MDHNEKRKYLIEYLLREGGYDIAFPDGEEEQKRLLRSLFNVRMPKDVPEEFLRVQDEYLSEAVAAAGVTDSADFYYKDDLALWRGDITTLVIDAIVNAANSQMLGCFAPCHACIDNCIHTYSGIQLRRDCYEIMQKQGHEEPTGGAKITKAYNLPCKYVLHTVGPIVYGRLTDEHKRALASCYESCLALADEHALKSVAFCCISTGEFCFPNEEAAAIAVKTVKEYKKRTHSAIKVVFNVFKEKDYVIYKRILG